MKLAAILAQSFKQWPARKIERLCQDSTGRLNCVQEGSDPKHYENGWYGAGTDFLRTPPGMFKVVPIAEDRREAIVSYEEWAEARQALHLSALARRDVDENLTPPAPWREGVDLPPVGTVCVVFSESPHTYWKGHVGHEVEVLAHCIGAEGDGLAVYWVLDAETEDREPDYHALVASCFVSVETWKKHRAERQAKEAERSDLFGRIKSVLMRDATQDDLAGAIADAILADGYTSK